MKCVRCNPDPDIFSLKLSSSIINEHGKSKTTSSFGPVPLQSIYACNILLTFLLIPKKISQARQGATKIKVKSC